MFKPLKKTSLAYNIVDYFIQLVREGKINPGDKLASERDMAEALQVSRSSVRTAMKILAYNQVVKIRPNSRAVLCPTPLQHADESLLRDIGSDANDPTAFVQNLEIRLMVEPRAARLAALYITDEELAELDAIMARMEQLAADGSLSGYAMEDMNFHFTYPKASRNEKLHRMMHHYCITSHHLVTFGQAPDRKDRTLAQHKAIVEAFRNHDADLAEELMRKHIYYAMQLNMGNLHNVVSWERFDAISYPFARPQPVLDTKPEPALGKTPAAKKKRETALRKKEGA